MYKKKINNTLDICLNTALLTTLQILNSIDEIPISLNNREKFIL